MLAVSSAGPYAGSVTLAGGNLTLNGAGSLSATAYTVTGGGNLTLDNTGTNIVNRLEGAAITLAGGTFTFNGNSGTSLESLGQLTLASGKSTVATVPGSGRFNADLCLDLPLAGPPPSTSPAPA